MAWTRQLESGDAWIVNCPADDKVRDRSENTLKSRRRAPISTSASLPCCTRSWSWHHRVGQKSGLGWGLDPDRKGAVQWSHRVGLGSTNGGMEWGSATDGHLVYFANADNSWGAEKAGGLAAGSKMRPGKRVWFTRPSDSMRLAAIATQCVQAQSARDHA